MRSFVEGFIVGMAINIVIWLCILTIYLYSA